MKPDSHPAADPKADALRSNAVPLSAAEAGSRTGGATFSISNRLVRLLWVVVWWTFASWTPRQLHAWRRLLLRAFGAKIAGGADVRGSAVVWLPSNLTMGQGSVIGPGVICYNQAPVVLGEFVLVSQRAQLCTGSHDYESKDFQLFARPIIVHSHSWLAAECFVGPGVVVGTGAVLGARAVACSGLDEWTVYRGNPACAVKLRRYRP